ncbi:holin [Shewanella putrefaciens]|uniref:holin n=1 Tax=Shewanella putrefaciens TaxID=24 RepID=UPI003D792131
MNNPIDNVSEVGSQKVVAAASYGASISTAAGGAFTVNELALYGGLLLALLTFIVNWVYQARKERREAELTRLESELAKARLAKELANG